MLPVPKVLDHLDMFVTICYNEHINSFWHTNRLAFQKMNT